MATFYRLEDLLADPSLLEPPPVVLPRLGWAGRLTLLAGPEKSGKSTLVGQGCAALATGGEFLGERVTRGTVLWLALDEPLNDVVRRFDRYGVPGNIIVADEVPSPDELQGQLTASRAVALVVDTLSEFARLFVEDFNSAAQWVEVLHRLRGMLQVTGVAGVLLHHTKKKSGEGYRDSTQIGAGVDAILEMTLPSEDRTVRVVRARGRMTMRDFRLRYTDPLYDLVDPELALDLRVYRVVQSQPGVSKRRVREAVYGASEAIDATLDDLCRRGAIEARANGTGKGYFVKLAG